MPSIPISPEFVEKYNKPGPRYTSYPTVPVWKKDFTASDYLGALQDLNQQTQDELALYLHLPFCAKHCHYCGCNALTVERTDAVDNYLDNVEKELRLVTEVIGNHRNVVQFHWGGGTPNFLNNKQITRVLDMFHKAFSFADDGELSLEIDPRISSQKQAIFLTESGFNRVSIGVQDFNEATQIAIGRKQSRKRTLDVYQWCRDAGFAGVNVDLVYGLPGQTRESFSTTLKDIIAIEPDRVACFSYAHVPWVKPLQNKVDTSVWIKGYEKFQLFQLTVDHFQVADYTWIGIDHFAKSDDELSIALKNRRLHRNFMGYATKPAPHMLAFGMSGIGDVGNRFVQNDSDLQSWQDAIGRGELPIVRGHQLTDDDRLRRKVILYLMCNLELPFDLTVAEFGNTVPQLIPGCLEKLKPCEEDGLVTVNETGIRITDKGRYFVRNVAMVFDAYLDQDTGSGKPVFSRTV